MSSNPTPAQEEYNDLIAKNTNAPYSNAHPEDRRRDSSNSDHSSHDLSEEDEYRQSQINAAMRMPTLDRASELNLPPESFDNGRSTGVKGVIADARSYETARKNSKWRDRARTARRSIFGLDGAKEIAAAAAAANARNKSSNNNNDGSETDDSSSSISGDHDDEAFWTQWRENRKQELESAAAAKPKRRTSPSMRLFGRFDEVDAMGYLDAIEKVGRDTVVAVFVYDPSSDVSAIVEKALRPLVSQYPVVHFVKVSCEEIEFDNAAVPAILAYRNQGDLFANLTAIVDMLPENDEFDSDSLRKFLQSHHVL